jgi:hypothetical protein
VIKHPQRACAVSRSSQRPRPVPDSRVSQRPEAGRSARARLLRARTRWPAEEYSASEHAHERQEVQFPGRRSQRNRVRQ